MKKYFGILLATLLLVNAVRAAGPFTVNTTSDTHSTGFSSQGAPGSSSANDAGGHTSLRSALEYACTVGGSTTINLPPGIYNLTLGDLVVGTMANTTIYIHGTGTPGNTTIANTVAGRMVFNVDYNVTPNVVFTLDNVTVTGGSENELDPDGFGGNGGAMLAGGSTTATGNAVTLNNCVFNNNYCSPSSNAGATGGAINMTGGGSLTIQNCTFSGNAASKNSGSGAGGAIYFDAGFAPGNVTIQNSTFVNNIARQGTAGAEGGAVYLAGGIGNTYTISDNTFTGNSALGAGAGNGGGAIFLATGNLTANFNRIAGNFVSAPTNGSGIHMLIGTNPGRIADVRNNWWGADGSPATGPGDDTVFPANGVSGAPANGQISFDPWIVLKTTVSPTAIIQGHSTTATASFLQNSAGGALTSAQIPVLIGLSVTWANAAHGSISGPFGSIQANGMATATFTAGTGSTDFGNNVGTIEAKVDNVTNGDTTATAFITIYQPPTITSGSAVTFIAGSNSTFTVTATAFPAAGFDESGTLPSGITLNSATGVLGGTPGATTGGVYPITINATNLAGTNTQSFTLTVDQAPHIATANNATFTVGSAGSFTVTATGFPQPALLEAGALPAGISFTNANGILAGTPAPGTGGIYPITFTATNGVLSNNVQSFTLTVNEAPTITSAGNALFTVGVAGTFAVTASGFPAPTFVENGALPNGMSFDTNSGVLSGTPAVGTGGTYPLVIAAVNTTGTNAQNFNLTVNESPLITSATNATFIAGTPGSFAVTASGFAPPSLSETGLLPAGVSFTNANGLLAGTPAAGSGGIYPIAFTATNSTGTNAQNFTLTVDEAPAITSASNTIFTVGSPGTFTVTASGFPAPTFAESGALPSGVSFDTNSGVLSGTPASGTGGPYPISFAAHNGVGSDAMQNFTLTINRPPIPGSTFTLGAEVGVPVTVRIIGGKHAPTDPDNDPLTITSVTGATNGVTSTDGVNVTYTATGGATDSFACTISDGHGGTASQTVNVSITPSSSTGFNQLSAQSLGNGTNMLTFLGTPGFEYALESTTNLVPPVFWQPQVTNPAAVNGWLVFTNVTSNSPVFYRTRYVTPFQP